MPDWKREISARIATLGLSPDAEADRVEELTQHFELEWAAAARLYGADQATQLLRAQLQATDIREWGVQTARPRAAAPVAAPARGARYWPADLRDDLRFALRTLRRAPAFAAVAIATLGLGIGATTAVYGVIDAVLVRSLPFPRADQLVRLKPQNAGGRQNFSFADFRAVRARATGLESIAAYTTFGEGLTFIAGDRPERVYGAAVSGDFFKTLGVAPLRGRAFTRDDELPGAPARVVLSYDFWQRHLGGASDIVGRTIELQGAPVPVIGIMPPGFWFPRGDMAEFWTNLRLDSRVCECMFTKSVIARVAPGVRAQRLQAEFDDAARDVRTQITGGHAKWTFAATPLHDSMVAGMKPVLYLLMAAVGFVLLIACVNVINLLLARATAREAELSVRVALGASRGRVVRQMLAETGLLALGGGLLALIIARSGLAAILALVPTGAAMLHDVPIGVDGHVLLVAGGCVLFCTLLVGLVPAIVVARRDAHGALRIGSQSRTTSRSTLRDALVIAEIALALMLVVGAGLMLRSLAKLRAVDTGVQSTGLITASVSLPAVRYGTTRQITGFTDRLLRELEATPGVTAAALSDGLPPDGVGDQENFYVEGTARPKDGWEPVADRLLVSDNYFAATRVPLIAGRLFDARDRDTLANPAIVSEALAQRFFPDRSPLGHRMLLSGDNWVTVVGVVGNVTYEGLASDVRLAVYEPFALMPQWSFSVVARSSGDPVTVVAPLRRIVASLDAGVAVARVRTINDLIDQDSAANRFRALLLGVLAALALLLASVGIYGLISFVTEARTRELGIRIALGAGGGQIVWSVLRGALGRALLGVAIGAGGALALSRLVTTLVFGVTPTDPITFSVVAVLLLGVAAAAAWLPARRAARSDPILVLRSE
jgi:predicted permease